jgi:phosphate transport system permease protein
MFLIYIAAIVVAAIVAYVMGSGKARALAGDRPSSLHSRPPFHGSFLALCVALPALGALLLWSIVEPGVVSDMVVGSLRGPAADLSGIERDGFMRDVRALAFGGVTGQSTPEKVAAAQLLGSLQFRADIILGCVLAAIGAAGFFYGYSGISLEARARTAVERVVMAFLIICSAVAVLTTIGILFSVLFETLRFFTKYPPLDFLFGLQWSPQRADFAGSTGAFGLVPVLTGTLLIMLIAMSVAGPIGLFAAIYMSEYAGPRFRAIAKPVLEVLAGVPTVVFGFFAALTVAPLFRDLGRGMGLEVASESALAAGVVMGVMIIPFISSLSDDVINAVPQSLRDGSFGMGATKSETIKKVVLPAALPGIASAFMLAISRAVGETMIVVMAAGLAANLTLNPLDAVTTMTVQIKSMLIGDQEFDSPKTLSAFALGFVLFFFTLALNVIALRIVKKYREQYD